MTTPLYRLMPLSPQVQALQQDATTEVLTLFPVQKREGLLTYGLPKSCELLAEALLKDLVLSLSLVYVCSSLARATASLYMVIY